MTYEKPYVALLGEATCLIHGDKPTQLEGPNGNQAADCEFDD
jgi:hypothetical protein